MTVTKVVRYRTKPECADENERLIRDVFAELADARPDGLQYGCRSGSTMGSASFTSP